MEAVILYGKLSRWVLNHSYGHGCGYGEPYANGSGWGYGLTDWSGEHGRDESETYWLATIPYFSKTWTDQQRSRLQELTKGGAKIAFWRSNKEGRACNGGISDMPVTAGTVERIQGPLCICTRNALHATLNPPNWKGKRVWVVALIGQLQRQQDKLGALEREIIGECL
jgi:hypothetical protein